MFVGRHWIGLKNLIFMCEGPTHLTYSVLGVLLTVRGVAIFLGSRDSERVWLLVNLVSRLPL